jgi:hypothetical protein
MIYQPKLLSMWEYPDHESSVIYCVDKKYLCIKVEYDFIDPQVNKNYFQKNWGLFIPDWFVSWERYPTGKAIGVTLSVNQNDPSTIDQEFAFQYEGASTDAFLAALLEDAKK